MKKIMKKTLAVMLVVMMLLGTGSALADSWQQSGGRWWYSRSDGSYPHSEWMLDGGAWYYFDAEGWMATGWQKLGGIWYYLLSSGKMATGWQKIGGYWYYFLNSGAMATDWQKIGGYWYYFLSSGEMATGWQKIGGIWYYFFSSGEMATGDVLIDGALYSFDASGAWIETGLSIESLRARSAYSGGPKNLYIVIRNNLGVAVDRVDFSIYYYNTYGEQVYGYGYYTHDENWYDGVIPSGGTSPGNHYWTAYGYDGATYYAVTILKYHTVTGETVVIPSDQRITYWFH